MLHPSHYSFVSGSIISPIHTKFPECEPIQHGVQTKFTWHTDIFWLTAECARDKFG